MQGICLTNSKFMYLFNKKRKLKVVLKIMRLNFN